MQYGDIIQLGPHRLMCGDSASEKDIAKLMDGATADMCFTDPPYGVSYTGKTKKKLTIKNDKVTKPELSSLVKDWFNGVACACREGAYVIATVPPGPLHLVFARDWLKRQWLRQIMVWNKDSMVLGHSEYHYKHEPILFGWIPGGDRLKSKDRRKTTVWNFKRPKASREHPTMKPVGMWMYGIKNHTEEGNIVFDPFTGSGTCLIACERSDRVCYGMEIDPHYCDVIIKRYKKEMRKPKSKGFI